MGIGLMRSPALSRLNEFCLVWDIQEFNGSVELYVRKKCSLAAFVVSYKEDLDHFRVHDKKPGLLRLWIARN
jgi:hypothetical protein